MRFATVATLAVVATSAIVFSVSMATAASAVTETTEAVAKDAATGSVPDLITPEQEGKMPYHACKTRGDG